MRVSRVLEDKRTCTIWEKDGICHRTNEVEFGGIIRQHSHKADHDTAIKGNFDCDMVSPDGVTEYRKCKTGDNFVVFAYWKHTLRPTAIPLDQPQIWQVDCSWPKGVKI